MEVGVKTQLTGDLDWWALLLTLLVIFVLFGGEPDIHDAIIHWLMECG